MAEIVKDKEPLPYPPENAGESDFDSDSETIDFLPKKVSIAFIVAWIVLFSGRWLIVQGLLAAGLLGQEQTDLLDEKVLTPCYVLLLSATIVVFVVRIVRGLRPGADEAMRERAEAETEFARENARQFDASAERGKQA